MDRFSWYLSKNPNHTSFQLHSANLPPSKGAVRTQQRTMMMLMPKSSCFGEIPSSLFPLLWLSSALRLQQHCLPQSVHCRSLRQGLNNFLFLFLANITSNRLAKPWWKGLERMYRNTSLHWIICRLLKCQNMKFLPSSTSSLRTLNERQSWNFLFRSCFVSTMKKIARLILYTWQVITQSWNLG